MGKKICILGAGNVGSTIAFTLSVKGLCSEIVLIDINKQKCIGEALDISQGSPYCNPVRIYSGEYTDAKNSDIVIVTLGIARKPGQSRLDLTQTNVNIAKSVIPEVAKYAPNAVYIVVSNPVDIITYTLIKSCGLSPKQVFGTGTMLDTARLRTLLGDRLQLNYKNVHAYVFGEHGDSFMIPWSLTSATGLEIDKNCGCILDLPELNCKEIEEEVRNAGAKIIACKGATYYAIATLTAQLVEYINQDLDSCVTVSSLIENRYGISDICLSLPFVICSSGIKREITPILRPDEEERLRAGAKTLKDFISELNL